MDERKPAENSENPARTKIGSSLHFIDLSMIIVGTAHFHFLADRTFHQSLTDSVKLKKLFRPNAGESARELSKSACIENHLIGC